MIETLSSEEKIFWKWGIRPPAENPGLPAPVLIPTRCYSQWGWHGGWVQTLSWWRLERQKFKKKWSSILDKGSKRETRVRVPNQFGEDRCIPGCCRERIPLFSVLYMLASSHGVEVLWHASNLRLSHSPHCLGISWLLSGIRLITNFAPSKLNTGK